ncbi:hypothetical protein FQN60_007971 [Etheostoma spectabile]|uniref:Small nuclear ribonucleoprotein Sm D3 n=1 Tax=Etheostoma spectabile TaxID=54343 RepID=A0A5J5CU29_9PERO|nr:hypothetical protein FQN60_007971 [Etheostoma spectabile]
MSIGVPIKVLHEAEGHIVTCETNTGEVYRGKLIEAEDNMNCQMSNITVTYRDGRVAQLEQVYIRGSKIRFLILPDMLKNAPMLKSMKNKNQGSGAGRGKAAILKAQGEWKWLQGVGAVVEWDEATSSRRGDNCSIFKIVALYSLLFFQFVFFGLDIVGIFFAILCFAVYCFYFHFFMRINISI